MNWREGRRKREREGHTHTNTHKQTKKTTRKKQTHISKLNLNVLNSAQFCLPSYNSNEECILHSPPPAVVNLFNHLQLLFVTKY